MVMVMADERWYQLVIIWLRDPAKFQEYAEALAPVVTRYGGMADQVFTPTAIHPHGLELPDVVNLVHYDTKQAFTAFSADPAFHRIRHLREESIDMLAFGGRMRQRMPAVVTAERVFGIEIARFRGGDPAAYRRYEAEGEPVMRSHGFHVDYVLDLDADLDDSPASQRYDLVKVSSFPSLRDKAGFERDPAHDRIETSLYPAAIDNVIWLDAVATAPLQAIT